MVNTITNLASPYGAKPPGTLQEEVIGGPAVSFRRAAQQGFDKGAARPHAFAELPLSVVEAIGTTTHKGVRLDLMVLAHQLFASRQYDRDEPLLYRQGFSLAVEEHEFVLAMQTTAEDAYACLTGRSERSAFEDEAGRRTDDFERFYRRIVYSYKRLQKEGWLRKCQYALPMFQGLYGTVWTLKSTRLAASLDAGDDLVDVTQRVEKAFLDENPTRYSQGEACVSKVQRHRYLDHHGWNRVVAASTTDQDRHVSIGAFAEPVSVMGPSSETPCTVPYVVLEVEAPDLVEAYEGTHRLVESLALDVDLSHVLVAFSGNKSFHVRLPHGLFGAPVYASVEAARQVLSRWAAEATDETLDVGLFDPRHLIRMIGSRHERGRYCTAMAADEFMGLTLAAITERARTPEAFVLADPAQAPPSASIMADLEEAAATLGRFYIPEMDDVPQYVGTGGAVARALEGCEEGELWHDRHVGRNKLVFVAACHFLRTQSVDVARASTMALNRRNAPPLPDREVKHCFASARRTLQKASHG